MPPYVNDDNTFAMLVTSKSYKSGTQQFYNLAIKRCQVFRDSLHIVVKIFDLHIRTLRKEQTEAIQKHLKVSTT